MSLHYNVFVCSGSALANQYMLANFLDKRQSLSSDVYNSEMV